MSNEERQAALELWLEERKISRQRLADALGVSGSFVRVMLQRETIPAKRHRQLVLLGIPEELLPPVFEGKPGRPRSFPTFSASQGITS